ncbi:hypothetical protein ACQEVS_03640 [Streptomyces sp. CA-181903]|uniref:hypothetical protein n=1 Tax=Streptomyces sp. CA-181903 TaxID=3240055 RepID=UPI003D909016
MRRRPRPAGGPASRQRLPAHPRGGAPPHRRAVRRLAVRLLRLPAPVQGLRLSGCAIERTDQLDAAFTGQLFQLPCDLGLLARENGDALDLAVIFDPAYAPPAYAENLLRRVDDALTALAGSGDLPWKGLVPPDPSVAGPR